MSASAALSTAFPRLARPQEAEIERLVTSFDTHYSWNYGAGKPGLRELYEKAKREQWNSTVDLAWSTSVDCESEIVPQAVNPFADFPPYQKLTPAERVRLRHGQISLQL